MSDRFFNEVDLREMLAEATAYEPALEPGRFLIVTRHGGRTWEVVVEPQVERERLRVITAYWTGPIPDWRT